MKVGLIARSDCSGLGFQTRRLARLLNPELIMLIDSTRFNQNRQHFDWYKRYNFFPVDGFPTEEQVRFLLRSVDVVISCELFYHARFTSIAKASGVKTILIANPEFFDWFNPAWSLIPLPDKIIVPSPWRMKEMQDRFNAEYLPTPIFPDEFSEALKVNLKREGKNYLFINGKTAAHDRNGLELLYAALPHSKAEYSLTIKSQSDVPRIDDPRVHYDFTNPESQSELYKDFDALILPRRYGGQALSCNEALSCGLPVIMPDIDPNNKLLPEDWVVPAKKTGSFMARTQVDIHSVDPVTLANKIDKIDTGKHAKLRAYELGSQFEAENLREAYVELIK